MNDDDQTERATTDPVAVDLAIQANGRPRCPRCHTRYERAAILPPDYKCSCGLELAYPELSPSGEIRGVLGWLRSPGDVVHQRYRVVQLLGRGGFGSTYLAEDIKLSNKRWALKEVPAPMYDEHESRILAKLTHRSIPGIVDREVADGMVYMVLEFGGNRTFESVRRAAPNKRVSLAQLAPWARQLCDVLDYMHAQTPPIVHRDLKPANVLIDEQDRVMLIDFGIAKEAIESEQTRALGRAVTPGYSPPEQAMGSGTDARSDVYALAATIYCMLTAQRPPGARERIRGIEIPLPSSVVPGLPPAIDRALLQALSLNPNERQQTVREFGIAFDYDARTVATYDDVIAPERTVMVGGPETARSAPSTGPQKSLKLGADGRVAVLEPPTNTPRPRQRVLLLGVAAMLVAAILVAYLSGRARVESPPTAPVVAAPPAAAPTPVPTAPTPTIAIAVPAAAVTLPATPPGSTAMDELLKRRKASTEAPAPITTPRVATKAAPPPVPPTDSAAVVPVPAGVAITPPSTTTAASAGPAPASAAIAPGASAWQKANAHTQFQE